MIPLPEHFDFVHDPTLSPEQIGALALMMSGEGPFHSHWLSDARPAGLPGSVGSSKSRRIIRELKAMGYVKVEATWRPAENLTRLLTSVRGNLALPFLATGPFVEFKALVPQEKRSTKFVPLAEAEEDDAMPETDLVMGRWLPSKAEILEAKLVEAEFVEEVAIVSTAKKARKPTIAQQTKDIRQDARWISLLAAYREMLRSINKIGNLGEVAQAAKAFIDLVPSIDANPRLMPDILNSLTVYRVACNGYPVRLSRYVKEKLWESYPPEEAIDWSDCRE